MRQYLGNAWNSVWHIIIMSDTIVSGIYLVNAYIINLVTSSQNVHETVSLKTVECTSAWSVCFQCVSLRILVKVPYLPHCHVKTLHIPLPVVV